MPLSLQHRRYMMGVVMLLMFMPPGMWVSSLPLALVALLPRLYFVAGVLGSGAARPIPNDPEKMS